MITNNFAVKKVNWPLWKKYISYINKTFGVSLVGGRDNYYGVVDGRVFDSSGLSNYPQVKVYSLEAFLDDIDPAILTPKTNNIQMKNLIQEKLVNDFIANEDNIKSLGACDSSLSQVSNILTGASARLLSVANKVAKLKSELNEAVVSSNLEGIKVAQEKIAKANEYLEVFLENTISSVVATAETEEFDVAKFFK